ncbi:MAG: SAM-dependent methyltransferase [Rhodospirillales bacterium]|nr:SAM-dependent methyltransferase [Rhodospirillales bacterium]
MVDALSHPQWGYYTTRDPLGRAGDFVTAPEISQVFGELIGAWCAGVWTAMGRPDPVDLIELGPGRGTLLADALRAIKQFAPDFDAALQVHLVETSRALRRKQADALENLRLARAPSWHDELAGVPPRPAIILANEFFDALPMKQYVKIGAGWQERRIGLGDDKATLQFTLKPAFPLRLPLSLADVVEGDVVEVSPAGEALAADIARRVAGQGGAALIVDYGHSASTAGDTLQAVRRHEFHGILDHPGETDLSHHVDFGALTTAVASAGARALGPIPQGLFLGRLGIDRRAEALFLGAPPDQFQAILGAVRRLVHPAGMGLLFKAFVIANAELPALPGFVATDGPI